MTGSNPPNEFRYHDDETFAVLSLVGVAGVLFFSSLVTGVWGVAALAHASWLETNDLPVVGATTWGIGMLVLASVQGITALLILFNARLGTILGVALSVLTILVNLAVVSAFPVGSVIAIVVNVAIIAILVAFRRKR